MAEVLLRDQVSPRDEYAISSAGIRGLDGQPAHPLAIELVEERGLDLSNHRARTVSPDMLYDADLILTMEDNQKRWPESTMPPGLAGVCETGVVMRSEYECWWIHHEVLHHYRQEYSTGDQSFSPAWIDLGEPENRPD